MAAPKRKTNIHQLRESAGFMQFKVIGDIRDKETIAQGHGIHDLAKLRKQFGPGRWRKCKGVATVLILDTGEVRPAELHWYEAHGIGRRREKIKRYLDR